MVHKEVAHRDGWAEGILTLMLMAGLRHVMVNRDGSAQWHDILASVLMVRPNACGDQW